MKITDVKMTNLLWGTRQKPLLSGAPETGTGPGWRMAAAFVEVFTDVGVTGISNCGGKIQRQLVEGPLKRQVVGEDPFNTERIWYKMFAYWRKPAAMGEHSLFASISGIDNAIWDVVGKVTKTPLYKLLGGFRSRISAYAAGGHYREGKSPEDLGEELKTYVRMGFRSVKMKIGGMSIKADEKRVRAARKAVGDDVNLMIDANNAYPNAYKAIKMAKAAAKYQPYWFEEPVLPDDRRGWLEVKRYCNAQGIAVAGGENEFTRWGSRDFIQNHCVDIYQIDANTCGGITECRKMVAMCSANHITVSPHGDQWVHAHLVAHAPDGKHNEVHMFRQYMWNLVPEIPVVEGYQVVPNNPGIGIEINRKEWESHIEGQKISPYVPRKTDVD